MKIFVVAKPRAKKEEVKKIDETHFEVWVKEPPSEGRANAAIIKALSGYFKVPRYMVLMVAGLTSKQKIFEVPDQILDQPE